MSQVATSPPGASPAQSMSRLRALDILRGIAILGTLASNIFVFVSYIPSGDYPSKLDAVLTQLPNGKFLSLLTFMFGIGLAIQRSSAAKRGQPWPHVYLWRGLLLFLLGFFHYLFVVSFDVLMTYAITGILVSWILLTSDRVQRWFCGAAIAVHVAYLSLPSLGISIAWIGSHGVGNDYHAAEDPPTPEQIAQWKQEAATFADQLPVPSWWSECMGRWHGFLSSREDAYFIVPMSIALFLLGAFAFRNGLFTERGARLRRIMMAVGVIGFTLDILGALRFVDLPGETSRYLVPPFATMGIAGLVAEIYQNRSVGWIGRRLEDVGRLALSMYVGQNIICSVLFSTWGFDLSRHLPESWGIWRVWAAYSIVTLMLFVFSTFWRMRFERGPLEWIWNVGYTTLMNRVTPQWAQPRAATPAGAQPARQPLSAT